jgi:hypothetical protein
MDYKKKTPKERFLTKVYSALQEFEGATGVEIQNISIIREPYPEGTTPEWIKANGPMVSWKVTFQ